MAAKIGRNERCPCGNGKKYKNCCAKAAVRELQCAQAHDEAVPRAMAWLAQHHHKAFAAALQQETAARTHGAPARSGPARLARTTRTMAAAPV